MIRTHAPIGRFRHAMVAVAAALTTLGVAACTDREAEIPSSASGIVVDDSIVAGETLQVTVLGDGPGPIELDVIDAFVTTTLVEPVIDGRAVFVLPAELSELSGLLTFQARGTLGDTISGSSRVVPAPAADPIDIHAGPRTIVADGTDRTMAVAIASDRFGNPVADGSVVTITRIDERGATSSRSVDVRGGLAASLLDSGTIAERIEVFAISPGDSPNDGSVASRRVSYQEVPGPAVDVELVVDPRDAEAFVGDGRGLIALATTPILDRFGNRLVDGHLVRVRVDGPDGTGELTARTIDGVGEFVLLAPDRPGTVTLTPVVDGVFGMPIQLDAAPAVSAIPVATSLQDGQLSVEVGPVLDAAGAIVADGTLAVIDVRTGTDTPFPVQLIDGRATVVAGLAATGPVEVTVTVLGISVTGPVR